MRVLCSRDHDMRCQGARRCFSLFSLDWPSVSRRAATNVPKTSTDDDTLLQGRIQRNNTAASAHLFSLEARPSHRAYAFFPRNLCPNRIVVTLAHRYYLRSLSPTWQQHLAGVAHGEFSDPFVLLRFLLFVFVSDDVSLSSQPSPVIVVGVGRRQQFERRKATGWTGAGARVSWTRRRRS